LFKLTIFIIFIIFAGILLKIYWRWHMGI